MTDYVRVQGPSAEYTVTAESAKKRKLTPINKPAVDAMGRPLPAKVTGAKPTAPTKATTKTADKES